LAQFVYDPHLGIQFRACALDQFFRVRTLENHYAEHSRKLHDALYTSESKEEFESLVPWEILRPYIQE
jgi:hypothetical protein